MQDKNSMKKIFFKKEESEKGYILAFTLIVLAVLLLISISVSRIMAKEMTFSRLVDYNKGAYFAANSGLECALFLDSMLKDENTGISVILNSVSSISPQVDFESNASNNVFFASSSVKTFTGIDNFNKITCASDGNYNKIFSDDSNASSIGFVVDRNIVLSALADKKSSYSIIGDSSSATTTFGFVLRQQDPNDTAKTIYRCVVVDFAKTASTLIPGVASKWSITSTGYSSCTGGNNSRVSRTIYKYSTD